MPYAVLFLTYTVPGEGLRLRSVLIIFSSPRTAGGSSQENIPSYTSSAVGLSFSHPMKSFPSGINRFSGGSGSGAPVCVSPAAVSSSGNLSATAPKATVISTESEISPADSAFAVFFKIAVDTVHTPLFFDTVHFIYAHTGAFIPKDRPKTQDLSRGQ